MRAMISHRGDTIIEVLLAVTIFSIVAVGAMSVMNRGIATAQTAVEINQVKQQIDSQAEALRAAHQAFISDGPTRSVWPALPSLTGTAAAATSGSCPALPSGAFIMNPRTGQIATPSRMDATATVPYAGVWYTTSTDVAIREARGIWIESSQSNATDGSINRARDFRIRACWYVPGSSMPQTTETLVRLYEP